MLFSVTTQVSAYFANRGGGLEPVTMDTEGGIVTVLPQSKAENWAHRMEEFVVCNAREEKIARVLWSNTKHSTFIL